MNPIINNIFTKGIESIKKCFIENKKNTYVDPRVVTWKEEQRRSERILEPEWTR